MDLNHEFYLTRDSIGSCLSTARRTNGAVAIFLPGVAKRLADLMMNGKIILDIQGEEKKKLTVKQLLDKFEEASGEEFSNDSAILG